MALLTVSNTSKRVSDSFSLQEISFSQEAMQKIAITGETGSGKSTLLRIIAGLLQADGGLITLHGQRVAGPDEQLIPGHPSIAYLSQTHDLRNNYRIEELLEYANRLPSGQAENLYRICRIDHLMKRKNLQLSGGEKQRVVLTRLLIGAPSLLLLDEPFSNLDPIHKQLLKEVLADIAEQLQITCILTSHDPSDTLSWADEIIILRNGRLVQQGRPETVFYQPVNEYAAGLFGPFMLLNREQAAELGIAITGSKQAMIRPNGIMVSADGREAVVTARRFYGNTDYLDISCQGLPLTMVCTGEPVLPGTKLRVAICAYTTI